MIKKLINRLRGKSAPPTPQRVVVPRDQHPVSRKDISSAALKTLYRLRESGHDAFLVGGCVRDLLLGMHPKDFDVSTSATPEQVKQAFGGQCQLIGRRFRLAHVRFGREIIEVATFRAHYSQGDSAQHGQTSHTGVILRDNVWGSIEEDAERRDFTVNALYYNITDFSVWDMAGGLKDIERRQLRLIGDPETRYREDPVRMLRAIRFAAKLEFTLEPGTAAPVRKLGDLLDHISSHRLFDEAQKLLASGHAARVLELLREYSLYQHLFPEGGDLEHSQRLLTLTAESTDQRIAEGKSVNPAFFYAALLWERMQEEYEELLTEGMPPVPALQQAGQRVISRQTERTAIPRFNAQTIRDIWEMQPKLEFPRPRQVEGLVQQQRFRAAYDFLVLREESGEETHGWGAWWTRYQDADPGLQAEMLRALERSKEAGGNSGGGEARRPRRRNPRKRRPASTPPA
ncbi:MAG: tRNA nucleotidyltransferase/poly(A) polymerase [Moraxellaceae bacterium]|jgi:poly(A) polymerase|nr:tRNA nucleotidyltransferase/poly(A) polymerase [Moraxellaceae bacterium]